VGVELVVVCCTPRISVVVGVVGVVEVAVVGVLVVVVVVVVVGTSQGWTQNTLCFVSAPCDPSAWIVTLT
jgi:hypothetical protein